LVLAAELRRRGGWRVVWISRDAVDVTKDYCDDHDIPPIETFADPTYRTYLGFDLWEVPNTLVVDGRGTVEKVFGGELQPARRRELFSYLGVSLSLLPPS
jgi:peroxiredoxin